MMTRVKRNFRLHGGQLGAALTIRITPRAKSDMIHDITNDGMVKIWLSTLNEDEKLNQSLIHFLGKILEIQESNIEIVAGHIGKDKLVTVTGMDTTTVQERIKRHLGKVLVD